MVPVGFHPSKLTFEEEKSVEKPVKEQDVLKKSILRIVEKTNLAEGKILEKIKAVEKEKNISSEVAALLVGKDYNVSIEDLFDEIEEEIFTKNKE